MTKTNQKSPLIRKTSQTFLWISFILMALSTIALYFYVHNLLQVEIEEELFSTEDRIERSLKVNRPPFSLPPVVEIAEVPELGEQRLKDTVIFDPSQSEMEEFRELISFQEINNKNYRITVRSLIVESENILIAVVASYLVIILSVFIFLFYFSKARNRKLWYPFFSNLAQMKDFSLASKKPIRLMDSDILEFHELKMEIETLTGKVRTDYLNLKQFTENVSHELQTPLAIIQAKIENIINGDNLNETQFGHLTSIQKDIQRLTQMNKRLTLLTKIENKQFVKIETVNVTSNIKETIENFHEISNTKTEYLQENEITAQMDPYLTEVLCNNLISNAIKHNPKDGKIAIAIKGNTLSVSNSGTKALEHPEKLYSRFYRESETEKSTGLGLAIVKRICELYGFTIHYRFENHLHIFTIRFLETTVN